MTNNIDSQTKARIADRVEGRDIEKIFDTFIDNVTDTVVDALELNDHAEIHGVLDYIIEATMSRFNYELK